MSKKEFIEKIKGMESPAMREMDIDEHGYTLRYYLLIYDKGNTLNRFETESVRIVTHSDSIFDRWRKLKAKYTRWLEEHSRKEGDK